MLKTERLSNAWIEGAGWIFKARQLCCMQAKAWETSRAHAAASGHPGMLTNVGKVLHWQVPQAQESLITLANGKRHDHLHELSGSGSVSSRSSDLHGPASMSRRQVGQVKKGQLSGSQDQQTSHSAQPATEHLQHQHDPLASCHTAWSHARGRLNRRCTIPRMKAVPGGERLT